MSPLSKTPYWRLSGFYFFYFASVGVFVPFWGLYLQNKGFSAQEIGELTAIFLGTRIIAPNIWSWIADHKNHRMQIVRMTSFAAVLTFAAILIDQSYLTIAIVMLVFSAFWNASLPQFEANTLQHLGEHSAHYSKIRLWGSVGFILVVSLLGALFETFNTELMPLALLITLTGIWLTSLTVPESAARHQVIEHIPMTRLLRQPTVIAFFTICFLILFSHGPYYTFYTIYLEQHHYSRTVIGQLWALGVVAEIIIFLLMHKWLPYYGVKAVLVVSVLLSALRWFIIGLCPDNMPLLIIAQILHAASFGSFHAAAIAWIHEHFTGKNQSQGQALYSAIGFGLGGLTGSLASGYLWDSPGPKTTFLIAGCSALLASWIAIRWLKQRPYNTSS